MRLAKLVALCAVVGACGASTTSGPEAQGGGSRAGGTVVTGGSRSEGGATGSGGTTATGGASVGGSPGSGGTTATGGATMGTSASGGAATGGRSGSGGSGTVLDAGPDADRRDGATGGSGGAATGGSGGAAAGGSGGVATGGASGGDGALLDAGRDARPEAMADLGRDGVADVARDAMTTSDGAACPQAGNVTWTLARNANASAEEQAAYPLITAAMDKAVYYYNCYTNITKKLNVSYNASVSTVDGNINGSIRFGANTSYMEYTRGMHEISHTVGVGTASNWQSFLVAPAGSTTREWTGAAATAELRAITGLATDVIKGDNQHFWPYGLNYVSEIKSEADVINHCRIVVALRKDMGM